MLGGEKRTPQIHELLCALAAVVEVEDIYEKLVYVDRESLHGCFHSEVGQMADAADIIESGVLILDKLLNSGPSTL